MERWYVGHGRNHQVSVVGLKQGCYYGQVEPGDTSGHRICVCLTRVRNLYYATDQAVVYSS